MVIPMVTAFKTCKNRNKKNHSTIVDVESADKTEDLLYAPKKPGGELVISCFDSKENKGNIDRV